MFPVFVMLLFMARGVKPVVIAVFVPIMIPVSPEAS